MAGPSSARDHVAVAALRATNTLSRIFGRGAGTVIGGRVGLALAPGLVAALAKDRVVIVVSGTNGKTTTTAMVATGWGGEVTTNETGSNMAPGLAASLATSSSTNAVFEVDEAWLDRLVPSLAPRVVVLLNLTRDQLDRGSEVRRLAERWRHALGEFESGKVVANANDPLVVYAAQRAASVYWCDVPTPWTEDAVSCPHCTQRISYSQSTWSCPCGFAKPEATTSLHGDQLTLDDVNYAINLLLPGDFNRSNAALAVRALDLVDVESLSSLARISVMSSVAGRFSTRQWRGQKVRLLLAKNPAGFAAMLETLGHGSDDLWLAINARVADGLDPSWLYDVPFESLRGRHVYCLGDRRLDLATRLYYADVATTVVDDLSALPITNEPVSLLANYTAFHEWLNWSSAC